MPVSNEDIMKKLERIESMLSKMMEEENALLTDEEKALKTLQESNLNLEFTDVNDWRQYIWTDCEHKMKKVKGEEIDFWCQKTNDWCRFEDCPLNKKA